MPLTSLFPLPPTHCQRAEMGLTCARTSERNPASWFVLFVWPVRLHSRTRGPASPVAIQPRVLQMPIRHDQARIRQNWAEEVGRMTASRRTARLMIGRRRHCSMCNGARGTPAVVPCPGRLETSDCRRLRAGDAQKMAGVAPDRAGLLGPELQQDTRRARAVHGHNRFR